MIARLKRSSLPKRLADQILQAIQRGELRPGQRILEDKLARQLHVARTTVREALQSLERWKLVSKEEGRGTFVTALTTNDINDCYAVRLQLEPMAAALAYKRANPEQLSQLANLLAKMRGAGERRDYRELSRADMAFHQRIWKMSGNKWLESALEVVCYPLLAFQFLRLYSTPGYDFKTMAELHRPLLEAFQNGSSSEVVEKTFREMLDLFRADNARRAALLERTKETNKSFAAGDQASVPRRLGGGALRRKRALPAASDVAPAA